MVRLVTQFDNADSRPSLATPTCAGCCCSCCCCCAVTAISVAAISARHYANLLPAEAEDGVLEKPKAVWKKDKVDIAFFMFMLLAEFAILIGLAAIALFHNLSGSSFISSSSAASFSFTENFFRVAVVASLFVYFAFFIALANRKYLLKYLLAKTLHTALISVPCVVGELILLDILINGSGVKTASDEPRGIFSSGKDNILW